MPKYLTLIALTAGLVFAHPAVAQSGFSLPLTAEDPPGELPLAAPVIGVETLDLGEVGSLPPLPPAVKAASRPTGTIASAAPRVSEPAKRRPLTRSQLRHLESISRSQNANLL